MPADEIARKRSVLLSARIRFSPQTQPIRETAIEKIIEQNLLIADKERELSIEDIEKLGAVCFAGGVPAIPTAETQKGLDRLVARGRVIPGRRDSLRTYRLSQATLTELWEAQHLAEARFNKVVLRLFQNAEQKAISYSTPLLESLCLIFATLGESYVEVIKGEMTRDDLVRSPSIAETIRDIKAKYTFIDQDLFGSALVSFFRDSDPDFDAIKWNLAQNYYVAKALGIDPSGYLLSEEIFGGGVFYLDTNILIPALEPSARHYRSFQSLGKACRNLNIEVHVCQISLDELRRVVAYNRDLIQKVADQIPDLTGPRVRGIFFDVYREQLGQYGKVNLDELFASFYDPMRMLNQAYQVSRIDDRWFVEAEEDPVTLRIAESVKRESLSKRNRSKGSRAALHDALLLRWIASERGKRGLKVWLITLDTS